MNNGQRNLCMEVFLPPGPLLVGLQTWNGRGLPGEGNVLNPFQISRASDGVERHAAHLSSEIENTLASMRFDRNFQL